MTMIACSSQRLLPGAVAVLFLGVFLPASAAPINSPASLNAGATIIDFEAWPVGTPEPISDGFATITSNGPTNVQGQAFTQYPGIFEGQYFGFGVFSYFIDFDQPVAEFGMGIFDPNFNGNILRAVDSGSNELESVVSAAGDPFFPTGQPGGGFSTFVGFKRPSADIKRIELLNVGGDLLGIDTVTYYVPEPTASVLLLIGGLASLGASFRDADTTPLIRL